MLNSELCTCKLPLYSMNPSFLNLFMKKLTRGRVVPIISASVSWLTRVAIGSDRPSLPKLARRRKGARQALFARIEQLIHQILLHPAVAHQEVGREHLGKQRLALENLDHVGFGNSHHLALGHRRGGGEAQWLHDQAALSEEVARLEHPDDRFLALLRRDRKLDGAPL